MGDAAAGGAGGGADAAGGAGGPSMADRRMPGRPRPLRGPLREPAVQGGRPPAGRSGPHPGPAPDSLCAELGQYDCIEAIHKVALGGVEAYRANIYRPFPEPSVAAPLIVERVALAACTRRIAADRAEPATALFWGAVPRGRPAGGRGRRARHGGPDGALHPGAAAAAHRR
ncbi:MAG: hypothetical protein R3F43_24160 [bacterium]